MLSKNVLSQPIAGLKPYPDNPRTHTKKQIQQIADSIREFGFTNPILVDKDNSIIAGHGRVEAAKLLGIKNVPTLLLSHLSDEQKRAYLIADNRLAELAGWDNDLLAIELKGLIDLEFDMELIGFETPEIDIILGNATGQEIKHDADRFDPPDIASVPITQLGDLWQLGRHRLLCCDARNKQHYETLMDGKKAQMVFTDPPYNVSVQNHVCGKGVNTHPEFAMASGEMNSQAYSLFLAQVMSLMKEHSQSGALHFICMDWRHMGELLNASSGIYDELKNLCIWNKDNGGMGSLYRSKHELVFVFKLGNAKHINNIELGKHGRNRTNVWDYPGVNSFTMEDRDEALALHPTVKPIAMVADALLDCSKERGLILDPFGGSGTTLLAAEQTGRIAHLIELEPHYCDVIIQRYQALTDNDVIHLQTGQTLAQRLELIDDTSGVLK